MSSHNFDVVTPRPAVSDESVRSPGPLGHRHLLIGFALAALVPAVLSFYIQYLAGSAPLVSANVHECLELLGSSIAVMVALLIIIHMRHDCDSEHLLWIAMGLLAMGILDTAHGSYGLTDSSWTYLRHFATLNGGMLFGAVWLNELGLRPRQRVLLLSMAAATALLQVLFLWNWAQLLPAPWTAGGDYSFTVKLLNAVGGLGFTAAAAFFAQRYMRRPRIEDVIFGSLSALFGVAGLLFGFSHLWRVDWWMWHVLRLVAFVFTVAAAYWKVVEEILRWERAEVTIAAERHKFSAILDALPPYVILLTPDYHVAFANEEFRRRFGEDKGRRCFEFLFGRSEPCEVCETYKVLDTGQPRDWKWTGPDGHHYEIHDFPFTDTDGSKLILEMGIDVSERLIAEANLRRSEAELREA